jgi:hypothetical protein
MIFSLSKSSLTAAAQLGDGNLVNWLRNYRVGFLAAEELLLEY